MNTNFNCCIHEQIDKDLLYFFLVHFIFMTNKLYILTFCLVNLAVPNIYTNIYASMQLICNILLLCCSF